MRKPGETESEVEKMEELLVVEDDSLLREGIAYALRKEGYLVHEADTLKKAREQLKIALSLIVLDLNLPDGDGGELLGQLREGKSFPVIVLTARDSEEDIVKTFDLGCDDYITKPFSTKILLQRIRAVLRRIGGTEKGIYCCKGLTYHFGSGELYLDGNAVLLTATEKRLLEHFLHNPNQVLTREQLLERVWDAYENYVDEKTVNVNIRRLREKIEQDPKNPEFLITVFGIGYKWSDHHA